VTNVVQFRPDGGEFPDLFPASSFLEVAYAVARNIPAKLENATYDYVLKANDPATLPVAVVLQSGGNVLHNHCPHFADGSRLKRWVDLNRPALENVAKIRNKVVTIVGKIRNDVFRVYYIIDEQQHVYFDERSIAARLGIHKESAFGGNFLIQPVLKTTQMRVSRAKNDLYMFPELDDTNLVGFPALVQDREDATDPRMYTEAHRMRFHAFVYGP
jgi:hypothetical protein